MIFIIVSCFSSHQCLFSAVCFNSANKLLLSHPVPVREQCSVLHLLALSAGGALRVLGHTIHQASQLLHHGLHQLLFVSVILPELCEYIVLFARILHPRNICE